MSIEVKKLKSYIHAVWHVDESLCFDWTFLLPSKMVSSLGL